MANYRIVPRTFTLDGSGAFTGDISLSTGPARLVSHFIKYTATAAGTSVTLTDATSGKALGAAIVGNTNVETQVTNEIVAGVVHVVITGGTAGGTVQITLYVDAG